MRTEDPSEFSLRIRELADAARYPDARGESIARIPDIFGSWDGVPNNEFARQVRMFDKALWRPSVGIHQRLPLLLRLVDRWNPANDVFWAVLARWWGYIVDWGRTDWHLQTQLLQHMRDRRRAGADRGLRVYRGCGLQCVRGMSWTTRRRVAEGYEFGARATRQEAVVASARISAAGIFLDLRKNGFHEAEIVLDPDRLTDIAIESHGDLHG